MDKKYKFDKLNPYGIISDMEKEIFKLNLENKYYNKNDIFIGKAKSQFCVTSKPKRKWYLLILQYLSLKFYKAPWAYNIEPIIEK
jgi:hypothetical protein